MATKRKNLHYFLIKVSNRNTIRIGVKARNAAQPVVLSREMIDIMAGTEGMAVTCANAQCALRQNGTAFPHSVYMAEFTDNRAYIVDKLNVRGEPSSCVVYSHNEGAFQKQFDTKGKNKLAKMSGVEKRFVLYPPAPRNAPGHGISHGGTSGPNGKARKTPMSKGAIARAERAGINLHPKASKK